MGILPIMFYCTILCFVPTKFVTSLVNEEEIVYERFVARNPRIIGFYPFIIPPYKIGYVVAAPCKTIANLEGTCMTKTRCSSTGGQSYGTCGRNSRGVCCISMFYLVYMIADEKSCGDTTSARVTYFNNPGFISSFSESNHCQLTVNQQNTNICQLRVEFLTLELAPPSYDQDGSLYGTCITDFLKFDDTRLPVICGKNSGQHVYVGFSPSSSARQITIDTSGTSTERKWSLKITQIPCNSTDDEKAPAGCLMYYNTTSGSVSSFNYDVGSPTFNQQLNWTRQITNLHYSVCVKPYPGYCSVEWSAEDDDSFSVSNVTNTELCQDTYITIPRSPINNQNTTDRFCGLTFPSPVTTEMQPFMLWVTTTLDPIRSNHTRGFKLNYRQLPCS